MQPVQPPHVAIAALLRWLGHHTAGRERPVARPQPARLTVHRSS